MVGSVISVVCMCGSIGRVAVLCVSWKGCRVLGGMRLVPWLDGGTLSDSQNAAGHSPARWSWAQGVSSHRYHAARVLAGLPRQHGSDRQ